MSDAKPASPNNDVAPFRQPMVTSIGILMGFLLNFIAGWATAEDGQPALASAADYLVAGSMVVAIGLMIFVLARLMTNNAPVETAGARYHLTYRIYISAILLAFSGFGGALLI